MKSNFFQTPAEYCQSSCAQELKTKYFFKFSRMIYNDKYKFIYCPVPKVGFSNWRRVFLVLSEKFNTTDPLKFSQRNVHGTYYWNVSYLSQLSLEEIDYRIKNYYKFIFIRDPLERIVSAYKNKFMGENSFLWSEIGKLIIRAYRIEPNDTSLSSGLGVTFGEFVQYILDASVHSSDEHWKLISLLCLPCSIKYDFVGHMDNMDSDSQKVLNHLGVANLVKYPQRDNDHKYEKTKDIMQQYYKKIPLAHLNKLKYRYYLDYLMFNLTFPLSLQSILNEFA